MSRHLRGVARLRLGGDVGLSITSRRVAVVATVFWLLVNIGNAFAITRRPWLDASQDEKGWLLLALEGNPSTWFTSVALLAAGGACLLMAMAPATGGGTDARRWRQLAIVPAALSLDEVAELHEHLGNAVHLGGPFHYGWVVPGAAIILLLAVTFAGFVWRQGPDVRLLLATAAAFVVGGGIAVEAVNGQLDERGTAAWIYQLTTTVEENLELAGVLLVLVGLVELAARRGLRLAVSTPVGPDRFPGPRDIDPPARPTTTVAAVGTGRRRHLPRPGTR